MGGGGGYALSACMSEIHKMYMKYFSCDGRNIINIHHTNGFF